MARRITIAFILLFSSIYSSAGENKARHERRFTFGAEWSYIMTLQSGFHHNYFSTDGYRVDVRGNDFLFYSNGDVYFHVGYIFDERWDVSMYLGYAGVHDIHAVIPVSVRGTRYFDANSKGDRWFAFTDLGSGLCLKTEPQEILTGKIGGGYRLSLSSRSKLDFIMAARITYTHPQVIDYGDIIPLDKTNRNNAYVSAISIGLGISF